MHTPPPTQTFATRQRSLPDLDSYIPPSSSAGRDPARRTGSLQNDPHAHTIIARPWKHSTSASFVLALEQLAVFFKEHGDFLEPWNMSSFKTAPTELQLFNTRKKHRMPAYPSFAEYDYIYNTVRLLMEVDGEDRLVPITPALTKHYWKEAIPLQWPTYWKQIYTATSPTLERAEERWESSCGYLFHVYCSLPKLGQFLQYVQLNKLNPYLTDGTPSTFYKNTAKGCGICKAYEPADNISYHPLLKHILCTCPIVRQAILEIHRQPLEELFDIVFVRSRKQDPDKMRIAYAVWHFERGLRQHGLDGHDADMFETFKHYLEYSINPGNPLITFSMFVASPLST